MNKDEQTIRRDWLAVLGRQDCIEIYEYLYNVILNEEYPLDEKFILELLEITRGSNLPCESGPYANLKKDIEHYMKVYSDEVS